MCGHCSASYEAEIFQTICAVCHGFDGVDMDFKDGPEVEYVCTVCAKNPWEAPHKIRFGQPGVGMVALWQLHKKRTPR